MTTQGYLEQAFLCAKQIQVGEEQIQKLRELSASATAAFYGDSVQTSRNNDKLGDIVSKIDKLANEYARGIARFSCLKNAIVEAVKQIDDPVYRMVMEKRYINFDTWEKIAEDTNYSVRHIYNLHKSALKHVVLSKSS